MGMGKQHPIHEYPVSLHTEINVYLFLCKKEQRELNAFPFGSIDTNYAFSTICHISTRDAVVL